jgi:hypothetical protein
MTRQERDHITMTKKPWPNRLGFSLIANGVEVGEVFTGHGDRIVVSRIEQDSSLCGHTTHSVDLARGLEPLGFRLNPEDLPGETLLALADESLIATLTTWLSPGASTIPVLGGARVVNVIGG